MSIDEKRLLVRVVAKLAEEDWRKFEFCAVRPGFKITNKY